MLFSDRDGRGGRGGRGDHDVGGGELRVIVAAVILLALGALAAWLIGRILAKRHSTVAVAAPATASMPPATEVRLTPEQVLAERLARGEIDPDDFAARVAVLRAHAAPGGESTS